MPKSRSTIELCTTLTVLLVMAALCFGFSTIPEDWFDSEFLRGFREGFERRAIVGSWLSVLCCLTAMLCVRNILASCVAAVSLAMAIMHSYWYFQRIDLPFSNALSDVAITALWSIVNPMTWFLIWLSVRICFRKENESDTKSES